jgi:hypothetical protein
MPRTRSYAVSALIIAELFIHGGSPALARKSARAPEPNNDRIEVIGHVALDGTGVTGVLTAEHWRKNYLYLNSAGKITVVDVTDITTPKIESEYRYSLQDERPQVEVVVGNAALLADVQPASTNIPRSISIMSFADPAKPTLVRQFTGITGYLIDGRRGLIYIVNNEGVWVLNQKPARDVELEKQYAHDVIYNH